MTTFIEVNENNPKCSLFDGITSKIKTVCLYDAEKTNIKKKSFSYS